MTVFAQQTQIVEVTSEPSHHLVFENAYLRVFDVSVAPKATTLVHRHNNDYVFVTLGDADITNAKVGAEPVKAALKDGDTRFTAGGFAHAAINNGDTPFRNITIEILKPTTGEHNCTEGCSMPVPCSAADKAACPAVQQLFSSDQWTVNSVTLPAGATIPEHTHKTHHLVVPVTELHLKMKGQNKAETEVSAKVGQVTWVDPVTHSLTNAGSKPARLITLEMKAETETQHSHP